MRTSNDRRTWRAARCAWLLASAVLGTPEAQAGLISADIYYEFSFGAAGDPAAGCDPADPAGAFCIPSSGTVTEFADAAPWTFTSPSGGSILTVIDAFLNGDRFEIFDFGVSLGLTSVPGVSTDCGDDPVPCLANAAMSSGAFSFSAGAHSVTIVAAASPDGLGAGYFHLDAADVVDVPEPGSLALLGAGLLILLQTRTRGRPAWPKPARVHVG